LTRESGRENWERNLLRIQRDVAYALNEVSNIEEGFRLCLDGAIEAVGMDCGVLHLLDPEDKVFKVVMHKNLKSECLSQMEQISPDSRVYEMIMKGNPVVGNLSDFGLKDENEGIKMMVLIPIGYKGEIIGCLHLASKSKTGIPKYVVEALETLASQFGISITAMRMYNYLQKSEAKYREIVDLLPDAVFEVNSEGKFLFASRNGFEKTGYTKEDLAKGLNAIDLIADEDKERFRQNFAKILRGERGSYNEYTVVRKDGTRFPVEIRSIPVIEAGKVIGVRGLVIDITNRKRMEEELVKSEKFEALSIVAGGVAHDLNNLIAIILGNVEIISSEPITENIKESLFAIEKAIMRAKSLTEQLMTFTKEGVPVKRITSLADLIKETSVFALRGSKASCIFNIPDDLWYAEVDEAKISQVIDNILLNSVQAMPSGGVIEISAENAVIGEDNNLRLQAGKYIKISIEDHGIGIPKDKLPYIFDPYFTTKEKGHGLGLASSYIIIKKHGGCIFAESEYGVGTKITFYLPATEERPVIIKSTGEERIIRGRGRVLLLEDDEEVKKTLINMLNKLGYKIEHVSEGRKAIDVYKQSLCKEPFDAVIMDLTIPGGYGALETVKELLKIDDKLNAILMTGYITDDVVARYKELGFKDIILKPFKIETLSKVLSRAASKVNN